MLSDERQLKAMRLLQEDPEISQRQLATAMGISVGATNYCLRALVDKGWVKLENFQKNPNKLGYLYLLTPTGVNAKAALTAEFLKQTIFQTNSVHRLMRKILGICTVLDSDLIMKMQQKVSGQLHADMSHSKRNYYKMRSAVLMKAIMTLSIVNVHNISRQIMLRYCK